MDAFEIVDDFITTVFADGEEDFSVGRDVN
jgi:hypothetical protein